jgi:CheY-like chemotaxis protein
MATNDLSGVHVLVVEDTDDSREMLRVALEYCGALVTAAATAEEAKRILATLRPHVLVSDIAMPDEKSCSPRDSWSSWRSPWTRSRSAGPSDGT